EARAALERARGRLGNGSAPEPRRRLQQGERDLALAALLDDIRLNGDAGLIGDRGRGRVDERYTEAFREAGLGQAHESPDVVAARVRASPIRTALAEALDHWSEFTPDSGRQDWILEVAREADPDPTDWRVRARDPAVRKDE